LDTADVGFKRAPGLITLIRQNLAALQT
jgi:hypothetical protein